MAEFVFQMIKARKSYGDRVILDDVTLSFPVSYTHLTLPTKA